MGDSASSYFSVCNNKNIRDEDKEDNNIVLYKYITTTFYFNVINPIKFFQRISLNGECHFFLKIFMSLLKDEHCLIFHFTGYF